MSGPVTAEKQEYYEKLAAEYENAEKNGTNGYRLAGFKLVQRDYEYSQSLQDEKVQPAFVDQLSAEFWLSADGKEVKNGLVFMAAVVLLSSAMYGGDIKKNMLPLLKSTPQGRKHLVTVKFLRAIIVVSAIYAVVYLPYYIYIYRSVGGLPWEACLQNYQRYSEATVHMTIGGLLALRLMLELLNGFVAAAFTIWMTLQVKNRITAVIIAFALTVLPLVLQSKGIELRWYSMNNAFLLGTTLEQGNIFGRLLLQEGIILGLGLLCVLGTRKAISGRNGRE